MLRSIKYLLVLVLALGLLFLLVFKPADRSSYQDQDFYSQMHDDIGSVMIDTAANTPFLLGWSRAAIIPQSNIQIASYGIRPPNEGVHDTIFASVFAVNNGANTAIIVTLDLLIFPPTISQYLADSLGKNAVSQIYLAASHTHNGPGGWMQGPAARFIAGKYEPDYVKLIGDSIISSINRAKLFMQPGSIKYGNTVADTFIKNRVIRTDTRDTLVKYLVFEKENKQKAILNIYNAHATCISHKVNLISRDYPGILCDALEVSGFDMAAFMAGPVGSMGNECYGHDSFECITLIGQDLAKRVSNQILVDKEVAELSSFAINVGRIKLSLKDPSPRLLENWSVRPWLYFLITTKQETFISFLQLGDVLFVGVPCDFSGVLSKEVYQKSAFDKLVITSFNGSYVGYVTPDRYYDLDESETHEMNWLGYGAGSYLADLIVQLSKHFEAK